MTNRQEHVVCGHESSVKAKRNTVKVDEIDR